MNRRWSRACGLALATGRAVAEPAVVASGAYPEGLLWHGGRMYFTEMGADRVSIIDNGSTRQFWQDPGCGPTDIAPFGPAGFLVNCHLGKHVVEVSAAGVTGRRFRSAADGTPLQDPNGSAGDGTGGVYFLRFRRFQPARAGDRQGLPPDRDGRDDRGGRANPLRQWRHLRSGDPHALRLRTPQPAHSGADAGSQPARDGDAGVRRLCQGSGEPRAHTYPEAGPDGIVLRPGVLVAAEYGEGRVHVFDRAGQHLNTLNVPMPFVDTVAFDGAGNLYAGGSFQNTQAPFEGAVVRFAPSEWERRQ